jgi:hypothetical protein
MKYHNQLPPGYKSHLALLVDQWPFIQSLEREDMSIIPTYKRPDMLKDEPIGDAYHFDIQYLKAKAMEEVMEFMPQPAFVEEVYYAVKYGLDSRSMGGDLNNHPAMKLANGLFERLLMRK